MTIRNQVRQTPLVLGIGDYFKGDSGVGGHYCEVYDAHWAWMGFDMAYLNISEVEKYVVATIMERKTILVVAGLKLQRTPGRLCIVPIESSHYATLAVLDTNHVLNALVHAVNFASFARDEPLAVTVALFEPVATSGFGLSPKAKAAMQLITHDAEKSLPLQDGRQYGHRHPAALPRLPLLGEVV